MKLKNRGNNMKTFKVSIKTMVNAIDEKNVQNWLNNFVLPSLKEMWSNGGYMMLECDIEEM